MLNLLGSIHSFSFETKNKLSNVNLKTIYSNDLKRKSTLNMAIKGPVRYSTNDLFECLITWPTSRILKRVKLSLSFFTLWSVLLTFAFKHFNVRYLLSPGVHSIAGSALSLLLVFRTNSAYDRFWEGRKLWSSLIMSCRDIARLSSLHIHSKYHADIAKLLVAFSICTKQHLQGEKNDSELKSFVDSTEELAKLQSLKNRPLYILSKLMNKIHEGLNEHGDSNTNESQVTKTLHEHLFEEYIHTLNSCLSGCERIVKQPVPLAYSRHSTRFLAAYLLTLPLTMIASIGWSTIPVMLAISWSFLSIQEIGHFIEEPFDKETQIISLPLQISIIRSDISELLNNVISSPQFEKFDEKMIAQSKLKSRMKDDAWFAYY